MGGPVAPHRRGPMGDAHSKREQAASYPSFPLLQRVPKCSMTKPRELAKAIWQHGVHAVRAEQLVAASVNCDVDELQIGDSRISCDDVERVCVVGAGKAAGFLAQALVDTLRPIADAKRLHGLINVPENCVMPMDYVALHAARPAGVNEPRPAGVEGTRKMLRLLEQLSPRDLCICLITGGGSALLPAPKPPVSLEEKLLVTKLLSSRAASIQDLNRVRISLSDVKGGGLAAHCSAGHLATVIVSDIIGDPLDLIASGPTLAPSFESDIPSKTLAKYVATDEVPQQVWDVVSAYQPHVLPSNQQRSIHMLGNNQTAVTAAAEKANALGLQVECIEPESADATAEDVAAKIVARLSRPIAKPTCWIWGGEPVVKLVDSPGKGGRNQQLALSALCQWQQIAPENRDRVCILSGGTDGEDGPTDAAGAWVDAELHQKSYNLGMDITAHLNRNDAYPALDRLGSLIRTGPTHTNVCDLRVVVVL